MNPLSRITEIVDNEEKNSLMEQAGYVFSEMIADNCFIVVSLKNTFDVNIFYPTISTYGTASCCHYRLCQNLYASHYFKA
jgi:hypothetical protein